MCKIKSKCHGSWVNLVSYVVAYPMKAQVYTVMMSIERGMSYEL